MVHQGAALQLRQAARDPAFFGSAESGGGLSRQKLVISLVIHMLPRRRLCQGRCALV